MSVQISYRFFGKKSDKPVDPRLGAQPGAAPHEKYKPGPENKPFWSKKSRELLGLDTIDERSRLDDEAPSKVRKKKIQSIDFFKVLDVCSNPECQHRVHAAKKGMEPPEMATNIVGLCVDCADRERVGEEAFYEAQGYVPEPGEEDYDPELEDLTWNNDGPSWADRFPEEEGSLESTRIDEFEEVE